MALDITDSFVKQFEVEVHEAYQRQGSKLRNTIRTVNGVVGLSTTFQKVGKGTASTKARHGDITPMTIDHDPIECTLQDFYAGDFVDKLDELKIKHDERRVIVNAGAFALGRKTDELIITEAVLTTNVIGPAASLDLPTVLSTLEGLGDKDALESGRLYAFVGWKQWTQLLQIAQFSNADFIAPDKLPFHDKGLMGKSWLGTTWMPHSGLPVVATERQCLWYNETALGHAIGEDITSDIDWQGTKQAHFITNRMSQGACLIDVDGVFRMDCTE